MAMASVRQLGAKTRDTAIAAVPPQPSLAQRLAEAQQAAQEPARRTAELEGTLRDALERQDYATAQAVKDELAEARREAAIANAAVTALSTAIAEIGRQQAEDNRAIQLQQQRDAAQQRINEMTRREKELLAELDADVAALWAGLEAVKRTYQHALSLEWETGQARREIHQARVELGEAQPVTRGITAPNKASILADHDPVIRALSQWAR